MRARESEREAADELDRIAEALLRVQQQRLALLAGHGCDGAAAAASRVAGVARVLKVDAPSCAHPLAENVAGQAATTVRARLTAHRENPSCNGCHGVIDPLGFALENFDAVGRWRDRDLEAGTAIDASGVLADGTPVAMPGHNLIMAAVGTFILALGWFGFNPGSSMGITGSGNLRMAMTAVTTMLAGASASITAMAYARMTIGKYDAGFMINGMLGGLVAITAPSAYVSPINAVIIGIIAALLTCVAIGFCERTLKIDDPVGAWVHAHLDEVPE